MKREAANSTKMKKLCKLLSLPTYAAVGILELLWHLTARQAPQGDIGKLPDEDIALALDYDGDAEKLVTALVECRWLDRSEEHRLIVHDWHVHSDDSVDLRLARAFLPYANGALPRMKRLDKKEKERLTAQYSAAVENKSVRTDPHIEHIYAHAVRTEAHNGALPEPEPVPEPVPVPASPRFARGGRNTEEEAEITARTRDPSFPPAADAFSKNPFYDDAFDVMKEVARMVCATKKFTKDQILEEARQELFKIAPDDAKLDAVKSQIRDGMATQWEKYQKLRHEKKLRNPVNMQAFFSDGFWKNSSDWGLVKGASANGTRL